MRAARDPYARRRWSSSYGTSLAIHLGLFIVPATCISLDDEPAPQPEPVSITLIGPSVEDLELSSLAPRRDRREPTPEDTDPPPDQPDAPLPLEAPVPLELTPTQPEEERNEDPKTLRFVHVEDGNDKLGDPKFIAAQNTSPDNESQARPDSLEVGPPKKSSPTSGGSTPRIGQGEATWEPMAMRLPEIASGGAPAPEDVETSEESSGVEGGEQAAELEPVDAEPQERPEEEASPSPGESDLAETGGPIAGPTALADGDEPGDAGPMSDPSEVEDMPSELVDVGAPDGSDAPLVLGSNPTALDGVKDEGPPLADLDTVPEGPEPERRLGGGEVGGPASAGSPAMGAQTPSVSGETGAGEDTPRSLSPGSQLGGDPTAPAALALNTGQSDGQAPQEQRRPRDGKRLDARTLASGPAVLETPYSPNESEGSPGYMAVDGATASSPVAVGDEALPLDATTAVSAVATDLGLYFHEVEALLRQRWRVPRELVYMGAQGTTSVRVVVTQNGQIQELEMLRMSGTDGLDSAAMAAFPKRLPRPPSGSPEELYLVFDFVQRDDWATGSGRTDR